MKQIISILLLICATQVFSQRPITFGSGGSSGQTNTYGTGTTSAQLQAAIDSLPAGGGLINVSGTITLTTRVTIYKPVKFVGQGMKNTIIQTASDTMVMFNITYQGAEFYDILFRNTSGTAPTAGCAIKYTSSGLEDVINERMFLKLIHCEIDKFYIGADLQEQYGLVVDGCHFNNQIHWDLWLKATANADVGDAIIANSFFICSKYQVTDAAIRWESGGGLKMTGNKFNWYYPYKYKRLIDGAITGTIDFVATGNSFENYTDRGISLVNGGGFFFNVAISGNQFASTSPNTTADIYLDKIYNVAIMGNVMENNGFSSVAIYLKDCIDATILNSYKNSYTYNVYMGTGNFNILQATTSSLSNGSNAAPAVFNVAFTGTQTVGSTLTGTYQYGDLEGDAEGATTKAWYRSNDNSGTGRAAISGATSTTYVLQAGDVGKFIQYGVIPVAATGTTPGQVGYSAFSAAIP